ncbi:MAG TPA: antibiotic biosynthesis monooxygenase [Solirubrobacteraceae bacterium]|jgi:heme-degrading monooxygenase HmoA|nr:antibiotic biosynthesis monooxygenase [Solirubrobacteraceae bacterium]
MPARSAVLQVSPDRVDAVTRAMQEELIPRYQDQDGYEGFVLLANRETGKVLGVSFWESESDLEASDDLGADARQRLAEVGGEADTPVRETWEVVVDDEP